MYHERNRGIAQMEKQRHYYTARDYRDYDLALSGFAHTARFLANNCVGPKLMVDIGTGSGKGYAGIQEKLKPDNQWQFAATNLTEVPNPIPDAGHIVYCDSLSLMQNFAPRSVHMAISVRGGISYTSVQDIPDVLKAIEHILVPGGVMKVAFKPESDLYAVDQRAIDFLHRAKGVTCLGHFILSDVVRKQVSQGVEMTRDVEMVQNTVVFVKRPVNTGYDRYMSSIMLGSALDYDTSSWSTEGFVEALQIADKINERCLKPTLG